MSIKLKDILLFSDLPNSAITLIESFSTSIELRKGNILFYEGDDSKYLHILNKGIIKLYKTTSNNKEIVLKYFHDNENTPPPFRIPQGIPVIDVFPNQNDENPMITLLNLINAN